MHKTGQTWCNVPTVMDQRGLKMIGNEDSLRTPLGALQAGNGAWCMVHGGHGGKGGSPRAPRGGFYRTSHSQYQEH